MDLVSLVAGGAIAINAASGITSPYPSIWSQTPALSVEHLAGTPRDRWSGYIAEAARRFAIPESWIRRVMHVESGGHAFLDGVPITSTAGAMGLMQVMPETYAELKERYGLGDNPYDPHDNILAGAAYLRQMYERYGDPGFLAAYNAGPARYQDYLYGENVLPAETRAFVQASAEAMPPSPAQIGRPGAAYSGGLFAGSSGSAQEPPKATAWRRLFFVLGSDSPRP